MATSTRADVSPLFIRGSTGLVREVKAVDQFIFNASLVNLGLAGVFIFEFGPFARPHGNIYLITLIAGLGFLCVAACYALLSSAFPRTGGDYVFNTRILGGPVGFWFSWLLCVTFATIGAASVAWIFAHSGIPFALSIVARVAKNATLARWATQSASNNWTTITATILLLLTGWVLIRGLGLLMKVQRVLFALGLLGLLAVLVLLATTDQASFARHYDEVAGAGSFSQVMAVANQNGFGPSWAWLATLSLFPMLAIPGQIAGGTNWFAGELQEIRSPRKAFWTMGGVIIAFMVVILLETFLIYHSVGERFLQAINFMFFTGNTQGYGFASDPNYFAFASITTGSVLLLVIVGLGWLAWSVLYTPANLLWPVRFLFAWSFDRLAPSKLADVNRRTNTPVFATVFVLVLAEVFLILAQYYGMTKFFVAAGFIVNVGMTGACFAAVLFPYVRRDIFESSPANIRWAGIPLIVIVGVIGSITMVIADIQFLTVKEFFVWAAPTLWFSLAVGISGIVYYVVARQARKRQGIDVDLVFAEIPPE